MFKKTIKFTDYDGNERIEDHYFNLTQAEIAEMEVSVTGGFIAMVSKIIQAQDTPSIAKIFKDLILRSYGEKSADGRRFIKSKELSTAFTQTEAFSILYMELITDAEKASEFINGISPGDNISIKDADKVLVDRGLLPDSAVAISQE